MSVSPNKAGAKAGVPLRVIVGVVVLLLVFVSWLAYRNLGPPPMGPTGPLAAAKNDWISQLAKQSGGDFSKIDPSMQQKLNMFTGGKGAELIKAKYNALH